MESNLLETLLPWQQSPPRPADAFEYTTLRPEVAVSADRRLLSFEYLAPGQDSLNCVIANPITSSGGFVGFESSTNPVYS